MCDVGRCDVKQEPDDGSGTCGEDSYSQMSGCVQLEGESGIQFSNLPHVKNSIVSDIQFPNKVQISCTCNCENRNVCS